MRDVVLKAGVDGTFGDEVSVLLGCAGESAVTRLILTLPLFEGNYYIDIELPDGQKTKDTLVQNGEFWEYIVPYVVTKDVGIGSLQVVVNSNNEFGNVIWKTVMLATKVQASVNATDFIANEYKDIFEQINDKIIELEGVVNTKVDTQDGKGLSTIDYTMEDKQNLTSLHSKAYLLGILQLPTVATSGSYSDLLNKPNRYESIIVLENGNWDYSLSDSAKLTMTQNTTLAITNVYNGAFGVIEVFGSYTLTLPANSYGLPPEWNSLTPVAGQHYVYSFRYDGLKFSWRRSVASDT